MHSTELERLSKDLYKYRSYGIKSIQDFLNVIATFLLSEGYKGHPPTNITFDVATKNISYRTAEGHDKSIQALHKIVDNSNIDFDKLSKSRSDIAVLSGIDGLHKDSTYFDYLASSYLFVTHTLVQYTYKHATESHDIDLGLHYYISSFINNSPIMYNVFQSKLVKEIELNMSTAYSTDPIRLPCLNRSIEGLRLMPVEVRAFSLLVHLHLSKQPDTYQFEIAKDNQYIQFLPINLSIRNLVLKVKDHPTTYRNAHQYVVLSKEYTSGTVEPENANAKLINVAKLIDTVVHQFKQFRKKLLHFKTAHSRVPNSNDIQCLLIRYLYRENMNNYLKSKFQLSAANHPWFTATDTIGVDRPLKSIEMIYSQFASELVQDIAKVAWHGTNPCHTEKFLTDQIADSESGKKLSILIETFQGTILIDKLSLLLDDIFNKFNSFIQQDITIRMGLLLVISHEKVTGMEKDSKKLLDKALSSVITPLKKNRTKYHKMLSDDQFFQHRMISSISKLINSIIANGSLKLLDHGKKLWELIINSQIGTGSDYFFRFLHQHKLSQSAYVTAINKANSKMKIFGNTSSELHIKSGHAMLDYAEYAVGSIRDPNCEVIVAPGASDS